MNTLTYKGLLSEHDVGDSDDLLFISSESDPLGEILKEEITGKQVTVRYWITDEEITKEEAVKDFLRTVVGLAECNFGARYSEITGYLWTDEECNIGGHDLLAELHSYVGKWLILEIDVH